MAPTIQKRLFLGVYISLQVNHGSGDSFPEKTAGTLYRPLEV